MAGGGRRRLRDRGRTGIFARARDFCPAPFWRAAPARRAAPASAVACIFTGAAHGARSPVPSRLLQAFAALGAPSPPAGSRALNATHNACSPQVGGRRRPQGDSGDLKPPGGGEPAPARDPPVTSRGCVAAARSAMPGLPAMRPAAAGRQDQPAQPALRGQPVHQQEDGAGLCMRCCHVEVQVAVPERGWTSWRGLSIEACPPGDLLSIIRSELAMAAPLHSRAAAHRSLLFRCWWRCRHSRYTCASAMNA
jgi:hypothetical protein